MNIIERLKGMNTARKVMLGVAGGLGALAASTMLPVVIFALPFVGPVTLTQAMGAAALFLAGYAKESPGTAPVKIDGTLAKAPVPRTRATSVPPLPPKA